MNLFNFLNIEKLMIKIGFKKPKRVGIKMKNSSGVIYRSKFGENLDMAIDAESSKVDLVDTEIK